MTFGLLAWPVPHVAFLACKDFIIQNSERVTLQRAGHAFPHITFQHNLIHFHLELGTFSFFLTSLGWQHLQLWLELRPDTNDMNLTWVSVHRRWTRIKAFGSRPEFRVRERCRDRSGVIFALSAESEAYTLHHRRDFSSRFICVNWTLGLLLQPVS